MAADTAAPETTQVTVAVTYRVTEVPPRCRKPRAVDHVREFTFDVPAVTAEDAPSLYDEGRFSGADCIYDGTLYEVSCTVDGLVLSTEFTANHTGYDYDLGESTWGEVDDHHLEARAREEAERLIVRDGELRVRAVDTPIFGWRYSTTSWGSHLHLSAGYAEHEDQFVIPAREGHRIGEIAERLAKHLNAEHVGDVEDSYNPRAIEMLDQPDLEGLLTERRTQFEELRAEIAAAVLATAPGSRLGIGVKDEMDRLDSLGRTVEKLEAVVG